MALLLVGAGATAPGAAASAPVTVPGWTQEPGSVAVDGAGRGLVAFGHGEHAWAVSVAPDGTLSGLGRIAAPRTEGGPAYVTAALSDRGDAVVEYSSSGGSAPGPDGYGFVFRPWISRFAWGTAPSGAQRAAAIRPLRVDQAFPVVRPDGSVLLSYTANDIPSGRNTTSLALARPDARVTYGPAVKALRHAGARSLTALPDGRAVGAWATKSMLLVGTFAAGASTPRVERFRADGRTLGTGPVGVDDKGDEVVAWQVLPPGADRGPDPIRVAARPAGAKRFGAPHAVGIRADVLLDAVVGPNGDAAFLMFHGNTAYVVRRTRDGALLPRLAIPGAEQSGYSDGSEESSARHTLAVTASGAVLIATGDQAGGRLLQIAPDGTQSVVAESPGCDADGVVVNRAGAGLMTLRCAKTRAVQTFTVPQAAAARAHAAAAARPGGRVIASGRGVARLSAYGGALVFSKRDSATKRWSLMLWRAGHVHRLAVPTRAIPFDADAGPGADGRPVAVFSSCTKDPNYSGDWLKAAGCHVERIALTGGNARPVAVPGTGGPGVSDTTPSIWRGTVAFARHQDGGTRSQVYTLPTGAAPVARPMPKVRCASDCDDVRILTTVQDLDLGPKTVVLTSQQDGGDTFGVGLQTTLQVDPLDGARPSALVEGFDDGACGYVYPHDVTATTALDGAFWVAEGSTCDTPDADFGAYGPGRRRRVSHPQGGVLVSATRAGRTTYWLRADRRILADGDGIDAEACVAARARCAIVADPALPWRNVPKGQAIGPYPEDE
ncbi:hypothetical protein [Conexibacter woesei]|uniref:hypothetical protein n=1 Tax=Conexibacter woesei TaxID=191495 RepID=UPI0004236BB5|nr:hypothetical protein [Conexibacter woesei]